MNIKLSVKIGKCCIEISQLLQVAFGENALQKSSVFEYHKRLEDGREDVADDPRSG